MPSIGAEHRTAIKQPLTNMEEQRAGHPRPTARPGRATIFLSRGTGHKPVPATLVRVDNRQAPGIALAAVQTAVVAEAIASATKAYQGAPAEAPRAVHSA